MGFVIEIRTSIPNLAFQGQANSPINSSNQGPHHNQIEDPPHHNGFRRARAIPTWTQPISTKANELTYANQILTPRKECSTIPGN